MPPELMAFLQQHAAAGAPPAGPPGPPGAPGAGNEAQPLAILRQMIQLGQRYVQLEPDPEDRATMAKVLATLHQYEAKDQQDAQRVMGANPSMMRVLRKAA